MFTSSCIQMDNITQIRLVNAVTSGLLVLNFLINTSVKITWAKHYSIIIMMSCTFINLALEFVGQFIGLKYIAGIFLYELAMPLVAFSAMACSYALMQFFEVTVLFAPKSMKVLIRINTFLSFLSAIWNVIVAGLYNYQANYQGIPSTTLPQQILYSKCILMVHWGITSLIHTGCLAAQARSIGGLSRVMGALFDRSARVSSGLSLIAILSIITMGLPTNVFTNSTQTLGNTFDAFSKMILSVALTTKLTMADGLHHNNDSNSLDSLGNKKPSTKNKVETHSNLMMPAEDSTMSASPSEGGLYADT